ncbi:MAG: hypothetical protein CL926_02620 [Deltaproteobacteria bacterium]|mgnify:CR=1 FL=1|jgi:hypothetical protein|nr:hypothetical protein [Gammaproteobacteria bacterium]MBP78151.1 hypothetical protein [Deltaproteobacteria bacterium]|tara:strand:+ start:2551 stop:3210 length:660 start_codon:yes stop_codon:yes gene_type:complete
MVFSKVFKSVALSIVFTAVVGCMSSTNRVVHLLDEPRHRTVFQDGSLYLLDVQLNPGDESLEHLHDQAILLTRISSARGPQNGDVSAITDYASQAFVHKINNSGPGLLRILAFVNGGQGKPGTIDRPEGMNGAPQLENQWFRSYRVELEPGQSSPLVRHSMPGFLAQVTPGVVHISREDGVKEELDRVGDWVWQNGDLAYTLKNVGNQSIAIVVNEGRR